MEGQMVAGQRAPTHGDAPSGGPCGAHAGTRRFAPADHRSDTQMQALTDTLARIDRHSVGQSAGSRLGRQETQRQAALRETIRTKHMQPIARISRAMLKNAPGIERALYATRPRARMETFLAD